MTNPTSFSPTPVDLVIVPRSGDIGGYEVKRALPFRDRRMVGPFIFWDQMGPGAFAAGTGLDVRPHPHIGLSTVTYLFEGSIDHRDSLGIKARILPGEVNVMTAGAGIVHSERTGGDVRVAGSRLSGIQSWLAQPRARENDAPSFTHIGRDQMPTFADDGVSGRVIFGEFHGLSSPVATEWDSFYVDLTLVAGARVVLPAAIEERAVYPVSGRIAVDGIVYDPERLLVLAPGRPVTITAETPAHLMALGGAAMDGPRFVQWNFVASTKARLEEAARDWRERRFPLVPGDESEFIPLPE